MRTKSFMTVFITILTLTVSVAQASQFETINQYFSSGTLPKLSTIKGWWSGRCYSVNTPMTAEAAILLIQHANPGDTDGPIFSPKNAISMDIFHEVDEVPPNYYDNLSPSEITQLERYTQWDQFIQKIMKPSADGKSWAATGDRWHQDLMLLRSYQGYIVGQVHSREWPDDNTPGNLFLDKVCYFFKKVHAAVN